MTMRKAIEVVTQLAARGVVKDYAITGAVAALAYVEPMLTQDLDILVSVADLDQRPSGLVLLTSLDQALADLGYSDRSDVGVLVEGWPVQFIPVASDLDAECLREAHEIDIAGDPPLRARVVKPEHVVAKALSIGRLKDLARVETFLEQGAVELTALKAVLERHHLGAAWKDFCAKSGRPDVIGIE
jgi:hypothetical protein